MPLLLTVLIACRDPEPSDTAAPDTTCSGSQGYCDRPYNQLAQVCTHNAFSSEEDGFVLPTPNQRYSFTRQLDDGVRCLMLDTYEYDDELLLCHGVCGPWGERDLVDGLSEIAAWMGTHPRDVVSLVLESYITEDQTLTALTQAGLSGLLYHHGLPPGSPWPTVGALIDGGQRLVVFTDDSAASDWQLDWRSYGWETPYGDPSFSCESGRGDPAAHDDPIFILNHYTLCDLGGCEENAMVNNAMDFLYPRAQRCWLESPETNVFSQIPTFVNVDHYQAPDGEVFQAVEQLNADWRTLTPDGG